MSALKAPARAASSASWRTGVQPTLARSTFTSRTTSASTAAARFAVEGAEGVVLSGAGVVTAGFGASCVVGAAVGVRGARGVFGVLGGAGGVLRSVTAGVGFRAGAAEGVEDGVRGGVGVADGFVDGAADGDAARPPPGPVPESGPRAAPSVVAAEVRAAPPWVVSSGVRRDSTCRSLVAVPPVVKVSPPGSRPEATAMAPAATAAEAPSSPVRTGVPRRLRRVPLRRPSASAAYSSAAGAAPERRWRPICSAFLLSSLDLC
ncbi:hypothetical protein GCM10022244_54920 [Streptomyces gulbargensis]|uniref:Uncharacterized protein n=1 Tax=Streptomyces gulbargensis TaxID=364901 RepID=A0ABP7N853_9ACTN